MQLKDILSNNEIKEYYNKWASFKGKYTPETSYSVHSNLSVIGKVFQFKDKPIFRAKILKNTIKRINPYHTNSKYPHANFHLIHYFFPLEQIGHASLNKLIPNYNQFMITDRFNSKEPIIANNRINFDKNHPSIELIADIKQRENRFVGKINTIFYEDSNNSILQTWPLEGIGELRAYANCIKQLKEKYDSEIAISLIKKIEARINKRKQILEQRNNIPDPYDLINQLREGNIPEQELHNFFSDWDKPQNL